MNRRRDNKGFTLAELIVTILIFSLCASTLLSLLTLALRYMKKTDRLVSLQRNTSTVFERITSELKTAVIDESSTGYKSLSPVPPATAVLLPSSVGSQSGEIAFTCVNSATYNPASVGFTKTDPSIYQIVRYYVSTDGTRVHREVKKYDSSGTVTSTTDDILAEVDEAVITLSVTLVKSDLVALQVTCQMTSGDIRETFTLRQDVFIPTS